MSRNGRKRFFPISRHFLSFLLFLDTFSLILDPKVSRNGNYPKTVTDAGPKQPFRCLDNLHVKSTIEIEVWHYWNEFCQLKVAIGDAKAAVVDDSQKAYQVL